MSIAAASTCMCSSEHSVVYQHNHFNAGTAQAWDFSEQPTDPFSDVLQGQEDVIHSGASTSGSGSYGREMAGESRRIEESVFLTTPHQMRTLRRRGSSLSHNGWDQPSAC